MKKLIAILAVAFAAQSALAEDSYLYWLVNDVHFFNGQIANFNYATISADNGETYLSLYAPGETTSASDALLAEGDYGNYSEGAPNIGVFAGFSGDVSSFLVELWTADPDGNNKQLVGYQTFGYSDSYVSDGTSAGGANALVVSTVVPEPTSGLMMLLGIAALALKRRKQA